MVIALISGLLVAPPIVLIGVYMYRRNLLYKSKYKSRILQEERPSFTAEMVCAARAVANELRWCSDPMAYYFLELDAKLVVLMTLGLKRIFGPRFQTWMVQLMSARTTYLDEFILESKPTQVVILGAGLDARPYRMRREIGSDVKFFEVDAPATQRVKRKIIDQLLKEKPSLFDEPKISSYVQFVSCDFSSESFVTRLEECGFDKTNPRTVVILEGVASYLPREALVETLKGIATFAPGTRFAMNIPNAKLHKSPFAWYLENVVGEQWKGAWDDKDTPDSFFNPLGFKVLDASNFVEVMDRMPVLKNERHAYTGGGIIFRTEVTGTKSG